MKAHLGAEKRAEMVALERTIDWQIAGKRGQLKKLAEGTEKESSEKRRPGPATKPAVARSASFSQQLKSQNQAVISVSLGKRSPTVNTSVVSD